MAKIPVFDFFSEIRLSEVLSVDETRHDMKQSLYEARSG